MALAASPTTSAACQNTARLIRQARAASRDEGADEMTLRIETEVGEIETLVSIPRRMARRSAPLIALHGIARDADGVIEAFRASPHRAGRLLIAPRFSEAEWPVFQRITERIRPDLALLGVMRALRKRGLLTAPRVEMFGFSGGAQLAHRFAMLYPHHIAALHVSSAGWYSLPDADIPYPYGLNGAPRAAGKWARRMRQGLPALLKRPITVYVGALDNAERDASLRRNERVDASQGKTRRARAAAYAQALRAAAAEQAIKPRVALVELPGCGHNLNECARIGGLADLVLSGRVG